MFKAFFVGGGFWERRNGHLRAAAAQTLEAGCHVAELFSGLLYVYNIYMYVRLSHLGVLDEQMYITFI